MPLPSFRDIQKQFKEKPAAAIAILALFSLSLIISIFTISRNVEIGVAQSYYYDLATGELFIAPSGQILPLLTSENIIPDNQTQGGVVAKVWGCGGCGKSQRFIHHLLTHNQATIERAKKHLPPDMLYIALQETHDGILVRAFDRNTGKPAGQWIPAKSPEAHKLISSIRLDNPCPPETPLVQCAP